MACICETCSFLHTTADGDDWLDTCEHGFPDERCAACEDEDSCALTCAHFAALPEDAWDTVPCSVCGKSLRQLAGSEGGKVFCPECYLAQP